VTVDKVPNAIPGRTNIELEIYGMEGIPEADAREHERQLNSRGWNSSFSNLSFISNLIDISLSHTLLVELLLSCKTASVFLMFGIFGMHASIEKNGVHCRVTIAYHVRCCNVTIVLFRQTGKWIDRP
jgi:hypothetical protein